MSNVIELKKLINIAKEIKRTTLLTFKYQTTNNQCQTTLTTQVICIKKMLNNQWICFESLQKVKNYTH